MINCVHPDHFRDALVRNAGWLGRIGGLRANASRLSHAELDSADEIDEGNPGECSFLHQPFLRSLPNLRVIGGCCGTDHRDIGALRRLMGEAGLFQGVFTAIPTIQSAAVPCSRHP
jgi:homocysteine S-methyltransferase